MRAAAAGEPIRFPNTSRVETSTDEAYYISGPDRMLTIWNSDNKVVEDWAFCMNHGRSFPQYDPSDQSGKNRYYYTGNTQDSFTKLLSTFLVSRPLDSAQTYLAVRELLYVFHEDPYGWRANNPDWYGDNDEGDMHWYLAIQQAIWHFTDNSWWPKGGPWGEDGGIDKDLIYKVARGERASAIPSDGSKIVDMRTYDVAGGFWRFGKQNAVTMRVSEKSNFVRILKLDASRYGNLSDSELATLVEKNRDGLAGAELALKTEIGPVVFEEGPVVFNTTTMAQPLEIWETHHFTLAENQAPKGFLPVDPVSFVWDANGNVVLDKGTPATTARIVPKSAVNWDNYQWDPTDKPESRWKADTIVLFDTKPEVGKFPLSIEKTGFVTRQGEFSKRNIGGVEFTLEGLSSDFKQTFQSKDNGATTFEVVPGKYRLTETKAPAGYIGAGPVEFTVNADGTISGLPAQGSVSATGSLVTVHNANEPTAKTSAVWEQGDTDSKRYYYTASELAKAPDTLTINDRIDYMGLEPDNYVAVASFVKNNAGAETAPGNAFVVFTVDPDKPNGSATIQVPVAKAQVDVNATTSFTVYERIYRESDVNYGAGDVPIINEGATPVAAHTDPESSAQSVMIEVTGDQHKVSFDKYDDQGNLLAGARLVIEMKQGEEWVKVHEWDTSTTPDQVQLGLTNGSYRLIEKIAPAGFAKPASASADGVLYEFTVNDQGVQLPQAVDKTVTGDLTRVKVVNTPVENNGELKTTVKANKVSGTADNPASVILEKGATSVAVVDSVEYKDLTFPTVGGLVLTGMEYELEGRLYEVTIGADGKKSVDTDKPIATKTAAVTADKSGAGTWDLDFGSVAVQPGKAYVVYEKATSKLKLVYNKDGDLVPHVVKHEDPSDNSQTFTTTVDKGNVSFSKVNLGGTEIAGAEILIKKGDEEISKWTSGDKPKDLQLEPGTYTFHEEAAPSGYEVVTDFNFTVKADGTVEVADVETNGNVEVSEDGTKVIVTDDVYPGPVDGDDKSPQLRTTVKAGASTAEQDAPARVAANDAMPGVQVVDTIAYKNLVAGEDYIVTGRLFEVVEGEVAPDAKPLAVKTAKLPASDTGAGNWELDFGNVTGLKPGKSYVVFETAESVNMLVDTNEDGAGDAPQNATHEDPKDKSQTVTVEELNPSAPQMATTVAAEGAPASAEGATVVTAEQAAAGVQVVDTITYKNLQADEKYTVTGTLVEVANGQVVKTVAEATVSRTSSATGEGTWSLDFGKVQGLEPGKSYVILEKAVSSTKLVDADGDGENDEPQVVNHNDPTDPSQTVTVEPGPDTPITPGEGDEPSLKTTAAANGASASAAGAASVAAADAAQGVAVTDTIAYSNLFGGKAYTVTAKLMKVENGQAVGEPILTTRVVKTAAVSGTGEWAIDLGATTGLEPGASYVVFEKAVSVDPLIDTDGDDTADSPQTGTHEDPSDPSQTVTVEPGPNTPGPNDQPKLATTAAANGASASAAGAAKASDKGQGITVTDTIAYSNLFGGKAYTVTAKLMKVENGQAVGEPILTTRVVKTADASGAGTWVVDLGTTTGLEPGVSYVVFERAVSVDKLVEPGPDGQPTKPQEGSHEDPTDPSQTVTVEPKTPGGDEPNVPGEGDKPELKTTVDAAGSKGSADAPATVTEDKAEAGVSVVDTIAYSNLFGGKEYTVTARLMKVENGQAVGDPIVTMTVLRTADASGTGTWEVPIGTVEGLEVGGTYVVFEKAVSVDDLIDGDGDGKADKPQEGSHEDPTDPSQTVTVKPVEPETPNTPGGNTPGEPGDKPKGGLASTGVQAGAVLALAVAVLAGGVFLASRRRRG
ncbi:MAG: VaFE repeat-containing surface-anchored protein [Schaalia hyovaginalis]|nr:VaFE repeat-containing surface-anchored protein [Schaalia hyovaginalis]